MTFLAHQPDVGQHLQADVLRSEVQHLLITGEGQVFGHGRQPPIRYGGNRRGQVGLQFPLMKQVPEEGAESRGHQLCSFDSHGVSMPQDKIRNVGRFHFSQKEGPFTEALDKKPTNEGLVMEDRDCDEPALGAQILFVAVQNVSQRWRVANQLSSWNNIPLSQVIEKLLECFQITPADSAAHATFERKIAPISKRNFVTIRAIGCPFSYCDISEILDLPTMSAERSNGFTGR